MRRNNSTFDSTPDEWSVCSGMIVLKNNNKIEE